MRDLLRILAFFFFILLPACSTNYPGLPSLPMKDWLTSDKSESSPKRQEFDIYSPDKIMTMDDLVWLAIQQSPAINSGNINLEIREVGKRDAKWQYLPEMNLVYHITNNMTKYNEGTRYAGRNYGETTYEVTFSGSYRNPVTTYFNVKAQDELLQSAIVVQRKLIADVIYQIGAALLRMNALEKNLETLEKRLVEENKRVEASDIHAKQSSEASYSSLVDDMVVSTELQHRETKMQLTLERTKLKQLVGLDLKQALKVDTESVFSLLNTFNPEPDEWKKYWSGTEENYLLGQQVKLESANILIAWASYLPNVGINVNESPGKGQSQSADAQSDQFLHLILSFPLLDWGRRLRQAESASLRQRQRRLDIVQRTREYEQQWDEMEQKLLLARTRQERWEYALKKAERRTEAMEIGHRHGDVGIDRLVEQKERVLNDEMALTKAVTEVAQTKLSWMHLAAGLSHHYLGLAGYERDKK